MLTAAEIRSRFLQFFAQQGHAVLPSAPLVPENDPTVLFTTAGMHPLVPYLLGQLHPLGKRLASSQKCVRTGDIDEVGDTRHLTFFEMLGNWSLGDYGKREAITWTFAFLTEELGIAPEKLYPTVWQGDEHAPRDDEAIAIWKEVFRGVGIEAKVDVPLAEGGRIFGLTDNWWGPAGATGPCGPDTEVYVDVGREDLMLTDEAGMPDFESGRLLEIWNNVFMQYRKEEDGSLSLLPALQVDTGMGLERITGFLQQAPDVFGTDLFLPILASLKEHTGSTEDTALRIAADHLRAAVFLIGDGVLPSNKAQGYVLRRLIRRAVLHLGAAGTEWIAPVVTSIVDVYAGAYPELREQWPSTAEALTVEVSKFQKTVDRGRKEIEKHQTLTGTDAFNLYQSYGFPLELTKEYARSKGIQFDEAEFDQAFQEHQEKSRTASAGEFASGLADHSDMTVKYHTATHLLHQALRDVLGEHVVQKGSNLNADRLRFDFAHPEKMTDQEIATVERLVNEKIQAGLVVIREEKATQQAFSEGFIGAFGHKYPEVVSTYDIGGWSREICTGPHVANTADLQAFTFKIAKEEASSSGVRRIKGVLETK